MNKLKKLVCLISLALIGCASSPWIDLGDCNNRARCVKAVVEHCYPDTPTRTVLGYMGKTPHVEVQAKINGKWQYAVLVEMDFKPDIIEFWDEMYYFKPIGETE
jgi:hypothetical protein